MIKFRPVASHISTCMMQLGKTFYIKTAVAAITIVEWQNLKGCLSRSLVGHPQHGGAMNTSFEFNCAGAGCM